LPGVISLITPALRVYQLAVLLPLESHVARRAVIWAGVISTIPWDVSRSSCKVDLTSRSLANSRRFVCRFFLFHLFESPKYLLSRGRQREAVTVVHALAYYNKAKTWLTEDILNEFGAHSEDAQEEKLSYVDIVKRQAEKFSTERIAPLFSYKKLGINTALLWFMWATIGMG